MAKPVNRRGKVPKKSRLMVISIQSIGCYEAEKPETRFIWPISN
jgi:hypothetical protein